MRASPAPQPPIRSWIPYWVLALSLLLTGVATYRVASTANTRDKLRFQNLVQKVQTIVDNRMDTYIALVRAPSGLFALDQPISRREFHDFVKHIELRQRYPGIQGIGFTRRILPPEKETVVAAMRLQEGQEGFRIWPDFPRPEIHSILYLEPMDRRNRAAIGFDMFTEPVRRTAMERARDTGQPAATGKVTLVQEIDPQKQAGFLVYVPVYRRGMPLRNAGERRAALEGFVYSPFRAGDLFHGILDTERNPMVSFQAYAGAEPSPEALLYESHPGAPAEARPRFRASKNIDLAGTAWTISYAALPAFEAISGRDRAYQLLALGLLTSGILFAVTRSQARARAEAETANRAKDQFMAALSHELRTPLSPVLAVIAGLEAEGSRIPADIRDRLAVIRRNVELEARLIDDLLDLTRITRGKLELKPEVTDLRQVLDQALEACCPQGAAERARFLFEMPEMDCRLWGDAPRLTQVFWNLFRNALKFSPEGGPIRVRARCDEVAGELVVEVVDTGIGIEPERLTRIFDAFEQGHRKITRQFGGLGLGLAISKAIVDLHGGRLDAASEGPGRGSTFKVHLPVGAARDHAVTVPLAASTEGAAAAGDRPLHILLVEDHPDTADAMATLLSVLGHQVTVAADAGAALTAAETAHSNGGVDLVLSDVGLPGVSGLELMAELKRRYQYRGIALSGYGMDEDIQRSREAGFERHLTKPVNLQILKEAIREVAGAAITP
ncbi:MAG TPA: CHASE domain-containing protein [Thermoanaerobaculia bacterium]